jgi:hypothetical protein
MLISFLSLRSHRDVKAAVEWMVEWAMPEWVMPYWGCQPEWMSEWAMPEWAIAWARACEHDPSI